jgi:hypothetical protein
MGGEGVTFKSKQKNGRRRYPEPVADPGLRNFGVTPLPPSTMQRLREFYQRYKQYILSDGLMYLAFIVALALMFVFFG